MFCTIEQKIIRGVCAVNFSSKIIFINIFKNLYKIDTVKKENKIILRVKDPDFELFGVRGVTFI